MCGRYVSVSTPEQLAEHFEVDDVRTDALPQRWNVAPSLEVYAVIDREDRRRLGTLWWGFVPHWAKQLKGTRQPINARLETIASSRMFKDAFARRRCLVPADGFYEWQDRGEGRRKQPYHLADPDGAPLAFAGIWSVWRDPGTDEGSEPVFSLALVTTDARGAMQDIHPRMPVILPRSMWADWLRSDPDGAPHLADTVAHVEPRLVATPISERVNNVRNDGPDLLEPATVE